MNKAQNAERSYRFNIAIRIALPFIVAIIFSSYILYKNGSIGDNDMVLFFILIISYVYFTTYMIYQSFQNTFLDSVTKVYTRDKILKIIDSKVKKNRDFNNLTLLNFKNIGDISDRYGVDFGDEILIQCVRELEKFLDENSIKSYFLGRYSSSYFLLYTNENLPKIRHLITIFSKKIKNEGVNKKEIILKFEIKNISYSDLQNSINYLINRIKDVKIISNDIDEFESDVIRSIKNKNFSYKVQKIAGFKDENLYCVIPSLKSENHGNISKSKISNVMFKYNMQINQDIAIFSSFFNSLVKNVNNKFIIEISMQSLNSVKYLEFLKEFIDENKIDASNIIIEFYPDDKTEHLNRLSEILFEYKKLGFRFAISHFGANNAFFAYFLNLDIDYIIYDVNISKNYKDTKVANTFLKLNELARQIGIKTILKFVDRFDMFEFAKNNKVDFVQGFYIQKPRELV